MQTELILINISGFDRPGVTSALTEILARYDAKILDIGQADIHHTLSLGILFKTSSNVSGDLMKDLLFKAYELKKDRKYKVGNLPSTVTLAKGDFVEFKDGTYAKAASDTKLKVVDVEEIGFPYCIGSAGVVITGDSTNEYGYAIDTRNVKYTIEVQ